MSRLNSTKKRSVLTPQAFIKLPELNIYDVTNGKGYKNDEGSLKVSRRCLYFKGSSKDLFLCGLLSISHCDRPVKGVRTWCPPELTVCRGPDFSSCPGPSSCARKARGGGDLSLSEEVGVRPPNRQVKVKSIDENPSAPAGA